MDLPYRAEYAKSDRSKCKACKSFIAKNLLRMATLTQSTSRDGKQTNWFHFECFFDKQKVNTIDDISNFESLELDDQNRIKSRVGLSGVVVPETTGKKNPVNKEAAKIKKRALEDFTIAYAKSGQSVCKGCNNKILKKVLRVSKKEYDTDVSRRVGGIDQWYHLSCFAKLRSELGYYESADKIPGFTELSKEDQAEAMKALPAFKHQDIPEMKKIKLEDDPLDEEYRAQCKTMSECKKKLQQVKSSHLQDLFRHNRQQIPTGDDSMRVTLSDLMTFGILLPCEECKEGQLVFGKEGYFCNGHIDEWVNCTCTSKEPRRIAFAIPEELKEMYPFLKDYKPVIGKRIIKDVNPSASSKIPDSSKKNQKVSSKIKLKLKGGSVVDPDSGLENVAHVYEDQNKVKWTTVLSLTDVQNNKNKFYKLQLLQADTEDTYWLFRSWGRIGTRNKDEKVDRLTSLDDAKKMFEDLYEEKSGNYWTLSFEKKPRRMYPIDIANEVNDTDIAQVQNLIKMIFGEHTHTTIKLEFELDAEKMPLGLLSKNQIGKAHSVLSELQTGIETNMNKTDTIRATNQFYTFIPHCLEGVVTILDRDTIKQKLELLDTLRKLKTTYRPKKHNTNEHMKVEITVLDRESEEFKVIQEYVKNTNADTDCKLDVEDVFTVKRDQEEHCYENRKLLWCKLKSTNLAEILSKGLTIAEPEASAPCKGIYFTDMVSNATDYCCDGPSNSKLLLLLCKVALGNVLEKGDAKKMNKPPEGYDSVKEVGKTQPNPNYVKQIEGAEVPVGEAVTNPDIEQNTLPYNEYVVYKVAQVSIKYLLTVNKHES